VMKLSLAFITRGIINFNYKFIDYNLLNNAKVVKGSFSG
jgi:hypothetical protein